MDHMGTPDCLDSRRLNRNCSAEKREPIDLVISLNHCHPSNDVVPGGAEDDLKNRLVSGYWGCLVQPLIAKMGLSEWEVSESG
jgi:hypothetical protein